MPELLLRSTTREHSDTREGRASLSHSLSFNLPRSRDSVMLSLVQLAQTTFRLHQPLAEEGLVRAAAAYVQRCAVRGTRPETSGRPCPSISVGFGRHSTSFILPKRR